MSTSIMLTSLGAPDRIESSIHCWVISIHFVCSSKSEKSVIPKSVSFTFSNDACKVGQVGSKLCEGAKVGSGVGLLVGAKLSVGETEGSLLGGTDGRLVGSGLALGTRDGSADRVG